MINKTYADDTTLYASDVNAIITNINANETEIGTKVDKVDGKGLSTNDFTSDYKTKLDGMSTGANKTSISPRNGYIKINDSDAMVYNHPSVLNATSTNPHGTTATDVGLGNVDNTSDLNKPISTATQNSLNDLSNRITVLQKSGTTPNRPTPTYIGQIYFDTTLGKPIWCKDLTPTWVDSTGVTV